MPVSFVIDASVALSWAFEDEGDAYTDAVLEGLLDSEAFAPVIWPLEVGNALLVAERKGRLGRASSAQFLELLSGLPIVVDQEAPERVFRETLHLAREYGLSSYDASYLELAIRLNVPLATSDRVLQEAAERCGIPLYRPAGIP